MGQAEEDSGLLGNIVEIDQSAGMADDIQ